MRLIGLLQERCGAAADIEVSKFQKGTQSDEEYENRQQILRKGFELDVAVKGKGGVNLFGKVSDIFNSPNFPDEMASMFIDSASFLTAVHNYHPRNSFTLFLDFTKPAVFDFSLMPSHSTPNESNIVVKGYDPTWVHGLFNEITKFIDIKPSKMAWLHKHSVYDLLVWLLGIPFGFWGAYKISDTIKSAFANLSVFVESAAYLYVFFMALLFLRVLFHYARWIWPLVEYRSPQSKEFKHRFVLGAITLAIIANVIYDVCKVLL